MFGKGRFMSFQGLSWASALVGISPLAKLVALRVGDVFPPFGDFSRCRCKTLLEWTSVPEADIRAAIVELVNKTEMLFEDRGAEDWWFLLPIDNENDRPRPDKTDRSKLTIYVISRGRFVKIGVSFNALERMKNLQAGAPEQKFTFIWKAVGPAYLIRKVEKNAHQMLSAHLVGNEWFSVTADRAVQTVIVEMAKLGLGTPV
jgi:hypothetical protein